MWVLHRGQRNWDQNTFVSAVDHHVADETPIPEAAVLQLDKDTGKVLRSAAVSPHPSPFWSPPCAAAAGPRCWALVAS